MNYFSARIYKCLFMSLLSIFMHCDILRELIKYYDYYIQNIKKKIFYFLNQGVAMEKKTMFITIYYQYINNINIILRLYTNNLFI